MFDPSVHEPLMLTEDASMTGINLHTKSGYVSETSKVLKMPEAPQHGKSMKW